MKAAVLRLFLCALCIGPALAACKRADPEPEPVVVPVPPEGREASGRDAPEPAAGTPGALSERERAFATEAATAALAQIEAGRLAAMRSSNERLRRFAEQVERDHAAIQDALRGIVREMGIDLPDTVAGRMRVNLDELAGQSGTEFDRRYVSQFGVEGSMTAIELFEREARAGQHPDLRALADRSLPLLREHLAAAQRLQQG